MLLKALMKLSLLIVLIACSSCGSRLPDKPSIDSGVVIVETNEVYYINNQDGTEYSITVILEDGTLNPELNKTITHSNEDWNKVLLYIRLLESKVGKKVRRELKKFRETTNALNEVEWHNN